MKKPEIQYPCKWPYRVIGSDEKKIKETISVVLQSHNFNVQSGNISKNGTYCSVHVEVLVADEDERNSAFQKLQRIPGVKMVF